MSRRPTHDGLSDEFVYKLAKHLIDLEFTTKKYDESYYILDFSLFFDPFDGGVYLRKDHQKVKMSEKHSIVLLDALKKSLNLQKEQRAKDMLKGSPFEGLV